MINLKSAASRRAEARAQLRLIEGIERRMARRFAAELLRATKAAAKAYPDWKWSMEEHKRNMSRLLREESERAARALSVRTRGVIKKAMPWCLERKSDTEEELVTRIVRWAKGNAAKKVTGVVATTRKRIANAVARGVDKEESPAQIARRIRDEVEPMSYSRARTIARTESHQSGMTGQQFAAEETAEELGLTMRKEWLATVDDRTRESHTEANGQTVELNDSFEVGDASLAYPGDPSGPAEEVINCRCVVAYEAK